MSLKPRGVHGPVRGKRLNRLLQIIALLRGPTSWNARRLAEHFQTTRRNVYRDLAVLELAGVPYYYDPEFGEGGGYRIRPEWWFPKVGLNEQECVDLAVLTQVAETSSVPLLESASEVRDKLLGTLPTKQQDLIRAASELFDILHLGVAEHTHARPIMLTLQHALLQERQLKATYKSPHEKETKQLDLQPRRVFLCRQAWYIAAYDNADRQTKLFRLARFHDLELTSQPITVDRNFSLREFLGNAWTVYRGERDWPIEIEFTPEASEIVAETNWHHTQAIEFCDDGSAIFRATVSGLEEIQWWVLGFGPRAKVRKPKELAERVGQLAKQAWDMHQRP